MRTTTIFSGIVKLFLFSALLAAVVGCAARNGWSAGKQATPIPPTVIPITPTVVHKTGSGEFSLNLMVNIPAGDGFAITKAEGTIPFTIHFNPKTNLFDVHGEGKGDATVEYKGGNCTAMATYPLKYYVVGPLVPSGGLAADKGNGCYMFLKITEVWQEQIDAVGSCRGVKANVMVEAGYENTYGPYKIPILDGAEVNDNTIMPAMAWAYKVKVQELDVPQETGCMEGR